MTITTRTIEDLKADGQYFRAGVLSALTRQPRAYGCHYGFRSDRDRAIDSFHKGFDAASTPLHFLGDLNAATDGYADDEVVRYAGEEWSVGLLRELADEVYEILD